MLISVTNWLFLTQNEQWYIYIYYLFVNGIIVHKIICIYVYNIWLRNNVHHMNAIIVNEFYALCKIHIVFKDIQWLLAHSLEHILSNHVNNHVNLPSS